MGSPFRLEFSPESVSGFQHPVPVSPKLVQLSLGADNEGFRKIYPIGKIVIFGGQDLAPLPHLLQRGIADGYLLS
ncbi:hypothetical protein N7510_001211 [Penicillium lagena]|uniref:uncharacterized protein n=1 Tax=Penicillium lagena TaxID=94218 RepID=UPI002542451B|nr:uncharacterized protein N7510_001211 [Penicillium lagena]KAJ5624902.1 hypothetical protein N7510_001211 [Penicillium lagena]